MKKTKLRVVLILLSINLVLVNLIVSSSNNSNSNQYKQISSLLPEDIFFTYNSSLCYQEFSFETSIQLDSFNSFILFFATSGDKTNGEGIKVTLSLEKVEVVCIIDRLFQDTLSHNLTQAFSYPEVVEGKMNVTITCEAQTSSSYYSGSLRIFSQTKMEKIIPPTITKSSSPLPVVPIWLEFKGNLSTVMRSVTTAFNNSDNFDKLNLSISFRASEFSAYLRQFEVKINDNVISTNSFKNNQLTEETFFFSIDPGLNFLTINFIVELCMDTIQLTNICLIGNGMNVESILPANTYDWLTWENNDVNYVFDLSSFKPVSIYLEQILQIDIKYGCFGTAISQAIYYEIKLGMITIDSGEISESEQISSPQTLFVQSLVTNYQDPLTFRIQGRAEGYGIFYVLNTSYVAIEPLPELNEQNTLERKLVETEVHHTQLSDPLILTFSDFFKTDFDYLKCNISLSFSLTDEFGSSIRQIDVLMKLNWQTVIDHPLTYEDQVNITESEILYNNMYDVTIILTIYGDGRIITLSNLKYVLLPLNSYNISLPEPPIPPEESNSGREPIHPTKLSLLFIEYGIITLGLTLLIVQILSKRKNKQKSAAGETQVDDLEIQIVGNNIQYGHFSKLLQLPKNWYLKAKESLSRMTLLPLTVVHVVTNVICFSVIIDKLNEIAQREIQEVKLVVLGEVGFYCYMVCAYSSTLVAFSAFYLASSDTFYDDFFRFTKYPGIFIFILFFSSWITLFIYIQQNISNHGIAGTLSVPFIFLGIVIFLVWLGKTKEKQFERLVKNFFKSGRIKVSNIRMDNTKTDSMIEEESLSSTEYNNYFQKIVNLIIQDISIKLQVPVNRFTELLSISPRLAHRLLIDVSNKIPKLGKYYITEQIYIRSADSEIRVDILEKKTEEKKGELISKYDKNSVNSEKTANNHDNMENQNNEKTSKKFKDYCDLDSKIKNETIKQIEEYSIYKDYNDGKILNSVLIRGNNSQFKGLESIEPHYCKLYESINLGVNVENTIIDILTQIVDFYNELSIVLYNKHNFEATNVNSITNYKKMPFSVVGLRENLENIRTILERANLLDLLITDITYNLEIILERNRKYTEVLPFFKLLVYSANLVLIANQDLKKKKIVNPSVDLLSEFSKFDFQDTLNLVTSFCGIELLGEKEFKNGKIIRNGILKFNEQIGEVELYRPYFETFLSKITMKIDENSITNYFYKGHSGIDEMLPNIFLEVKYSSSLNDVLNNFTYKTISSSTYHIKNRYIRGLENDPLMILFGAIKIPLIIKSKNNGYNLYDISNYKDLFELYFSLTNDKKKENVLSTLILSFQEYFKYRTKEYGFGQRMMLLRTLASKSNLLTPEKLIRFVSFLQLHTLVKDGLLTKFLFFNIGKNSRFIMHKINTITGHSTDFITDSPFYLESNSAYISYRTDQVGKFLTYLGVTEYPDDVKFTGCMEKSYEVIDGDFASGFIFFYYKNKIHRKYVLGYCVLNEFIQDFTRMKFSKYLLDGSINPFYDPFDVQLELTTYKVSPFNEYKFEYSIGKETFVSLDTIDTDLVACKLEEKPIYSFLFKTKNQQTDDIIWKQKEVEFSPYSFDKLLKYSSEIGNKEKEFIYMTFLDVEGSHLFSSYSPYFRFDRGLGHCYFGGDYKNVTLSMKALKRAEMALFIEARKTKGLIYTYNEFQYHFELTTVPINIAISQLTSIKRKLTSVSQNIKDKNISSSDVNYARNLFVLLYQNHAIDYERFKGIAKIKDYDELFSIHNLSKSLSLLMNKIGETINYYWELYLHAPFLFANVNTYCDEFGIEQIHYRNVIYNGKTNIIPDHNPIGQSLFILTDLENSHIKNFTQRFKKLKNFNGYEFSRKTNSEIFTQIDCVYDSPFSFIHNVTIADNLSSINGYQDFILNYGLINLKNSKILHLLFGNSVEYKPRNNFYRLIKLVKDYNRALYYNEVEESYLSVDTKNIKEIIALIDKGNTHKLSKFDELYIYTHMKHIMSSLQRDLTSNNELRRALNGCLNAKKRIDTIYEWVKQHYIETNELLNALSNNQMVYFFKNYPTRGHCASIEATLFTYSYFVDRIKNMQRREEFIYLREDLIKVESSEIYLNEFLFKTVKLMVAKNALSNCRIFTNNMNKAKQLLQIFQLIENRLAKEYSKLKRNKKDTKNYHLQMNYKKMSFSFDVEDMMLIDILYRTYFIYLGSRSLGNIFDDYTTANGFEKYIPKKYSPKFPDFLEYEIVLNLKGGSWGRDFNLDDLEVELSYMKSNIVLRRADKVSANNRLFLPHIIGDSTGVPTSSPKHTDIHEEYIGLIEDYFQMVLKKPKTSELSNTIKLSKEKYQKLFNRRTSDPLKSSVIFLLKWGNVICKEKTQ